MPISSALVCVRCGARYPIDRCADDCPACRTARGPSNLTVAYDSIPAGAIVAELARRHDVNANLLQPCSELMFI